MNSVTKLISFLGTKFPGVPVYEASVSSGISMPFIVVRLRNHSLSPTLKGFTQHVFDTYEVFYISRNPATVRELTNSLIREKVSGISGLVWVVEEDGQHDVTPPSQAEEKGVFFAVKILKVITRED